MRRLILSFLDLRLPRQRHILHSPLAKPIVRALQYWELEAKTAAQVRPCKRLVPRRRPIRALSLGPRS